MAHEIRDLPNVLGFDTLNEPSQGWACRETPLDVNCWPAPMGWSLTGWDAIRLGSGCAISVRCVRAILIISLMYHRKSHTGSRLVLKHQRSNTGTLLLLSVQFRTCGNLESNSKMCLAKGSEAMCMVSRGCVRGVEVREYHFFFIFILCHSNYRNITHSYGKKIKCTLNCDENSNTNARTQVRIRQENERTEIEKTESFQK